MYIHIGGNISLDENDIIGIFDIEKTSVNKTVNEYLSKLQKQGRIYYVSYDMPKSFIVCKNTVYISNVSVMTLKKRALNDNFSA